MIPMSPELVQNRWVGFSTPPSPSLDTEPGMNFDTSWWRPNNPSSSKLTDPLYWNENNARPTYPKERENDRLCSLESLPDRYAEESKLTLDPMTPLSPAAASLYGPKSW